MLLPLRARRWFERRTLLLMRVMRALTSHLGREGVPLRRYVRIGR